MYRSHRVILSIDFTVDLPFDYRLIRAEPILRARVSKRCYSLPLYSNVPYLPIIFARFLLDGWDIRSLRLSIFRAFSSSLFFFLSIL